AQVAVARRARSDRVRLVGAADVQRGAIALGVHGDRRDVHLAARADDAHGDLAAVRDQDFLHLFGARHRELATTEFATSEDTEDLTVPRPPGPCGGMPYFTVIGARGVMAGNLQRDVSVLLRRVLVSLVFQVPEGANQP